MPVAYWRERTSRAIFNILTHYFTFPNYSCKYLWYIYLLKIFKGKTTTIC